MQAGTDLVLAGNHTLEAAKDLGWTEIAATYVEADEETAKRIVLVDNRSNDVAGYDPNELLELLNGLEDLEGSGFDAGGVREVIALLDDDPAEGLTDPDDIPDPPARPRSKPGELYQLGAHRLYVGDATEAAGYACLLEDGEADAIWTDPPYNVAYVGKTADALTIEGDRMADSGFEALLLAALGHAYEWVDPGCPIYLAHAATHTRIAIAALEAAGFEHHQTLVWVKSNTFVLGRSDYNWQHEPILYGWKPGAAHRWYGGFDKSTLADDEEDLGDLDRRQLRALVERLRNERGTDVTRADKPARSELHPTTKPVALVEAHLRNSTQRGDVVLDPFAGAGTTLIAAELMGRSCRAIEIDPVYADVIVKRWEQVTGKRAKRATRVEALA